MAYYLMAKDKQGSYKSLNIEKSSLFKSERKFKKPKAYTLQEIDRFTSEFEDELHLKQHLLSQRILPQDLASSPLSIKFIKQDRYDSIKYDVLYQDSIEYIMETERLVELIMRRYYANDFEFIKKLASRFSNFRECRSTAPELVCLADLSIQTGRKDNGFNELDANGDNMIARLIKLLILKYNETPKGEIEYKDKYNYRNLHLLISFVLDYYKNLEQELTQKEIKPLEPPCFESKGYTRTRKLPTNIAGQMTIKDLI